MILPHGLCMHMDECAKKMKFSFFRFQGSQARGYTGFQETGMIKQGENHKTLSKKIPRVANKRRIVMLYISELQRTVPFLQSAFAKIEYFLTCFSIKTKTRRE